MSYENLRGRRLLLQRLREMPLCLFEFVSLLVELLLESVSGTGMARSLQGRRLAASRFSQFAACYGAPSHRPSQGSGLRRFSKGHYSRDLRPVEWGSMINLRRKKLQK